MQTLLQVIHIFAAVFLVLVVLLQSGRGGGMGAAFGGASNQIFGGRGAGNFLSRVTSGAAVVFFCTSLTLSMLSSHHRSVVRGRLPTQMAEPADAHAKDEAAVEQAPTDRGAEQNQAQESKPAP